MRAPDATQILSLTGVILNLAKPLRRLGQRLLRRARRARARHREEDSS